MRERNYPPHKFFHYLRGGPRFWQGDPEDELETVMAHYEPSSSNDHEYWDGDPQSMVIDEVEAIWSAIDERDDWQPLMDKVAALRRMGKAHGAPPKPAGHA